MCALLADAENVFRGRVQRNNEQVLIQQDDAPRLASQE